MSLEGDSMDTSEDHLIHIPSPPLAPALTQAGWPQQSYRLPARYRDLPPEGPAPVTPSLPPIAPGSCAIPPRIHHILDPLHTTTNQFGLLREYPYCPSFDPDASIEIKDLSNYPSSMPPIENTTTDLSRAPPSPPWPFESMTVYMLMEWMITGSNQKLFREVDRLADVVMSPDFDVNELANFSARSASHTLDQSENHNGKGPYSGDAWQETHIDISIPLGNKNTLGLLQKFSIPGLHYRPLLGVLKSALTDVSSLRFHFSPFKRFWKKPCGHEERCFDELYTSDAWLKEHDWLQHQPNEPGCKFEKVILGLMLWSDSTHLANFGSASVWPLYLYFDNLSKYFRGKPGSGASHHIAYIPSVSTCLCESFCIAVFTHTCQ